MVREAVESILREDVKVYEDVRREEESFERRRIKIGDGKRKYQGGKTGIKYDPLYREYSERLDEKYREYYEGKMEKESQESVRSDYDERQELIDNISWNTLQSINR